MAAWRPFVLVLLPFAAGYYLSYVFRTINALIAGALTDEVGLSPADLGLLTSIYFLAMAAVQFPLGVLLDRYGPRRVQAACLLFAAAGATVFACATSMLGLMLGRGLIGVGVAAALMASLKAVVLWFPKERIAFANGCVVMLGALGAVTATAPAEALVTMLGWRGLFLLLSAVAALCALVVYVIVPEVAQTAPLSRPYAVRLSHIYRDARFLRLAPLSTLCIGTSWALQGLWAAPWLEHVEGFDRAVVVHHLLLMGLMLSFGALLLGWGAERLRRLGVTRETCLAAIAIVFIAAQLALALRVPVPACIPWAIIAAVGATTVLSFAILPEYFPKEMSARANAALNILHLTGAFALQYVMGLVVSLWVPEAGHPPAEAYQAAIAFGVVLQSGALLWFLIAARVEQTPLFHAGRPALRGMVARHRGHAVDYGSAQLAISRRVAQARTQLAQWRQLAIASAAVCLCLGGLLVTMRQSHVLAHIVEAPIAGAASQFGGIELPQWRPVVDVRGDCAAGSQPHRPQDGEPSPATCDMRTRHGKRGSI